MTPKLENVAPLVRLIRGEKVLLDSDLAGLYGVSTKALNQAVKRNLDRFPADFMFQLNAREWDASRSQIVTASPEGGAMRSQSVTASRRNIGASPNAFTEQGVAMLSSEPGGLPRPNLVAPFCDIVAVPTLGTLMAEHFAYTQAETDVICAFDLKFRIGVETEDAIDV